MAQQIALAMFSFMHSLCCGEFLMGLILNDTLHEEQWDINISIVYLLVQVWILALKAEKTAKKTIDMIQTFV